MDRKIVTFGYIPSTRRVIRWNDASSHILPRWLICAERTAAISNSAYVTAHVLRSASGHIIKRRIICFSRMTEIRWLTRDCNIMASLSPVCSALYLQHPDGCRGLRRSWLLPLPAAYVTKRHDRILSTAFRVQTQRIQSRRLNPLHNIERHVGVHTRKKYSLYTLVWLTSIWQRC